MASKQTLQPNKCTEPFFVNSNCIDCGSCWQIAPEHFARKINQSIVHKQPSSPKEIHKTLLALIDCPVAAIGPIPKNNSELYENSFPIPVTNNRSGTVYYCGWSSKLSYGASSWLIAMDEGNILIDSPRWSAPLARKIKTLGGIKKMILTHKDDVADHAFWAKEFKCERWMHKNDAEAAPQAEKLLTGKKIISLGAQIKIIPTPGHTAGSIVILMGKKEQILFSGDHLWWDTSKNILIASKKYCWWDWSEQVKSIERLLELDIRWLLPGHGSAHQFKQGEWKPTLEQTLKYARETKMSTQS